MARDLGRHASSISREIHRHGGWEDYKAKAAEQAAARRRTYRCRLDDPALRHAVQVRLQKYYSPEQIVGAWPRQMRLLSVSTIYNYMHQRCPAWFKYLRQARSRKRWSWRQPQKYERIRQVRSITERPAIVQQRSRWGDWESDTLRGADHHAGLATHVERMCGYVILAKLTDRSAEVYNQSSIDAFHRHGALIRTLTVDHGMEFSRFKVLEEALGGAVYFAHPHCPWQRGSNENANGLLRQYFPKERNFRTITEAELRAVESQLNARPRKRLGYLAPADLAPVALHC